MKHLYTLLYILLFPCILWAYDGNSSIEFIENKGQWVEPFLYRTKATNFDVFLEKNGFTYLIGAADNTSKAHAYRHGGLKERPVLNFFSYKVLFQGANPNPGIASSKHQSHYYNYFLGSDPAHWKSGIHPAYVVDYTQLYPGVDMHVSSEGGNMKYDFIVAPGANAAAIKLNFVGPDGLTVKQGRLQIHTDLGVVEELVPYSYQYINGERKIVVCDYKVVGNTVTYTFPEGYDKTQTLVIDPTLEFATFTGSTSDNWGFTATFDDQGDFYAGGIVDGAGYPGTTGFFQSTYAGGGIGGGNAYKSDIAITKFDKTGSSLIYSTYLGGAENEQPHSMIVDANYNLIVAGRSYSNNFPVTPGAFQTANKGLGDIVITKFNPQGTALIGSTFVGGTAEDCSNVTPVETDLIGLKHNYGDDARSEVNIDNAGNIYMVACTKSTDFPTVNPVQASKSGGQDAVIIKMDPNLTAMIWGTYYGGTSDDAGYVLALDRNQSNIFIAGGTESTNLPTVAGTKYKGTHQGGAADGFIAKFTNGGTYNIVNTTYIGGNDYDQCYGIQIDNENAVYVMGQTLSANFPVNATYKVPNSAQFVMKLQNDLTASILSTVFGSGSVTNTNISPVAFLVDTCQNIYISGWGGNILNSPPSSRIGTTNGMPVSAAPPAGSKDPYQATTDGKDMYFIVLSKNMQSLLYGSYMGANGGVGEHVDGGTSRFDKTGIIYQAICGCGTPNFPTTTGAWRTTSGHSNCNLVALKIAFNLGAVNAKAEAFPNSTLCLGESIQFKNNSGNATSYEWDFGDGSPISTQTAPTYNYTKIGKFKVRMVAINPNACKVRDTAYLDISVDTNKIKSGFKLQASDSCYPFRATVENTSVYSKTPGSTNFTKFVWDYGDGNTATGANPPPHFFSSAGKYKISLVMIDTTACNSPDTLSEWVEFTVDSVRAKLEKPDNICERNNITFNSTSLKATSLIWYFGDGDTASATSVKHEYKKAGTYTVKLVAYNAGTCNKADSVEVGITVNPSPLADFVYTPVTPETNVPLSVTNKSKEAVTYGWDYGDASGSNQQNPPPHQYKRTGTYTVCLVATNVQGCSDTICKPIETDVYPLADIPTAFSPNGDGSNDILYVMGAGIELMDLRIYNRWGEQVFHSAQQANGWDGTFKSKPQEMDAYAYTLNITFIDGTTLQKKGNVTLIR